MLSFLLLFFALFLLIKFLTKKKFLRIYKPKGPHLLSQGEKRFFDVLSKCISSDMYICPKVRIADLVTVSVEKTDPNYWKALNSITQKHVDFVIVKTIDFSPLLVIELDGGSHNEKERANRDVLVDNVFESAGFPILHVPVTGFYDYKEISEKIKNSIKTLAPIAS